MAIEAMKPQHQLRLINSNFTLLEAGKYQIRGTSCRKVVEPMVVSSPVINDQSLVSEFESVSEVLKNQSTSTTNKIINSTRCRSKEEQDLLSKQPCNLADTFKVSPQLKSCLLENQSTNITMGETETEVEVHHEQETRANMTIPTPVDVENKDDDHNLDVSQQNEAVHDDIVALSANSEQKEKPAWNNLRQAKSSTEKELKRKLSFYLTRQECEEDFILLTGGSKLPRPKKSNKKSRELKAILDSLSPGLKFHGMSADTYKVTKR
ncbi:hypothetical protein FRX31_033511 [Thalictrum thalictroides]|uniref:Uncharacterized protein n=1 Tax=Thalictrum thalictroides TaxID=46969 RepID=A0A7J6UXI6_THATH|nr:hypothetical protein FRX31_033511 [Thalictrum thalictroides]